VKLPGCISRVALRERREATPDDARKFLTLYRLTVVNTYSDGTSSPPYGYDGVLRRSLDAVAVALTADIEGQRSVCLRTALRPTLLLRETLALPQRDGAPAFALLELPAGLIEAGDMGEVGLLRRAHIETLEETGYRISQDEFETMGSAPFASPGVIPERIFFVHARVADISDRTPPAGDGSPAEAGCDIVWIPLDEAVKMCELGVIADMKTELGLRRIASRWH
jgi:8-oxo-dGTP pyrophosphatase MutT (NUDIX family)